MDVSALTRRELWRARNASAGRVAAFSAMSAALVGAAIVLGASAGTSVPLVSGLLRGTLVAAPLLAAAYAFREPGFARFGRLLLAVGVVSFLATLGESPHAGLYTAGRIAGWGVEVLLVLLVLRFPTGRAETSLDRRLCAAMIAVVTVAFLPTLATSPTFPVPSPWTSCTQDCPPNALFPFDAPPLGFNLLAIGGILLFAVLVGVVVRLQQRADAATGLRRQMLLPLLWVSMVRAALVGCAFLWRLFDDDGAATEVCAWLIAALTPLVSIAFLVGLVRMRLFAENAMLQLATCARRPLDASMLQREFARAFHDPTIEILVPAPARDGSWLGIDGRPVPEPTDGARHVHVVDGRDGMPLAGLLCDASLAEHGALLEAGTSIASVALENVRLQADADSAARELRRSRARIAAAADRERRRIERDLHDGAQQRLVALRIELGLVEGLVRDDPERCVSRIRELEEHVDAALEDLRSLAHGVRPPLLQDRGLAEALRAASANVAAARAPAGGRRRPLSAGGRERGLLLRPGGAAERRQARHRAPRTPRCASTAAGCRLRFSVRDDGSGADGGTLVRGMGLTNMADRLAAVGGGLATATRGGVGTTIRGDVPVSA